MAGRREFYGSVGRALYREHLQRSGQCWRGPGATAQHRGQSERRTQKSAGMVRDGGFLATGVIYLWDRTQEYHNWSRIAGVRFLASERHPTEGGDEATVSRRSVQPF